MLGMLMFTPPPPQCFLSLPLKGLMGFVWQREELNKSRDNDKRQNYSKSQLASRSSGTRQRFFL